MKQKWEPLPSKILLINARKVIKENLIQVGINIWQRSEYQDLICVNVLEMRNLGFC